jgi:DNA-binding CsgD family transcriptional regulator
LEWPLVGRDAELAGIARARSDRSCRGVVLSATAGTGKSRLAREACAAARHDGSHVDWVQATTSAATVPLGAFAGLLPDEVRTDDPLELMRRSVTALRERAGDRPVVLGVDDAQLLDPVSAALVLQLTVSDSVFVLATVRTGEPCPDAIVSLWKDAGADRLDVPMLSDEAIETLVEAALGDPVDRATLRWVCERSQGNALYVRELVIGALGAGSLVKHQGMWRLVGAPTVSQSLVDLVAQRMDGIPPDEHALLELLSIGEPVRIEEAERLSAHETLVRAEADAMISVQGDSVRLAHPLYGDVIRRDLPPLRARDLRLTLAETLRERDPLAGDDALRIARWLLDAGTEIPLAVLEDGARAAHFAGDPDLAVELAERARSAGGGIELVLVLARAHAAAGRFERAVEVLAAAEGEIGIDEVAIEYLELRCFLLFWGLQRLSDVQELLARAESWSDDPIWHRRLLPIRLAMPFLIAGVSSTLDESTRALADPELEPDTRRGVEAVHATSLFHAGRAREAYELLRRDGYVIPTRSWSDVVRLMLLVIAGAGAGIDLPAIERTCEDIVRESVAANASEPTGLGAYGLGAIRLLQGRYADARRWLVEAELSLERRDSLTNIIGVLTLQLEVADTTGDHGGAAAVLERLRARIGQRQPPLSQAANVVWSEAFAAAASGDRPEAQRLLLDGARAYEALPSTAALLAYDALREGARPEIVAPLVSAYAARCDFPLAGAYAEHAAARAASDAGRLIAVADQFAAIGTLRYGMEAALDAAEVFLAEGREDSARRAVARARELFAPDQGMGFPAVDGLGADAVALTSREAQVVELAGRGLTNAEIADQLVLSVRTVESHVYRAMQKLGLNNRRDL